MVRLRALLERLRSGLWFIPAVAVTAAVALALGLIALESRLGLKDTWPFLFGIRADGARETLSAIAGSMVTVAGVVFSITIVVLALASSQYSPRVLRNFMRDRATQVVLGVFVAVFAYALVALLTIRSHEDGGDFVPALAVLGGVALAFVAIGFLVYFIHHIAVAIQAAQILANVAAETIAAVDRLFPQELGEGGEAAGAMAADTDWQPVPAAKTGYVQRLDADELLAFACHFDTVVRMERAVGEFVIAGEALVSLAGMPAGEAVAARLNGLYTIGRERTVEQDAAFGIRQMTDVALKALSPGINDVTTAVTALDWLRAVLMRLARRRVGAPARYEGSQLRVLARGPSFADLLDAAFDPLRQNAAHHVVILDGLLDTLDTLLDIQDTRAGLSAAPDRRLALYRQAGAVQAAVRRDVPDAGDRARLEGRAGRLLARLADSPDLETP